MHKKIDFRLNGNKENLHIYFFKNYNIKLLIIFFFALCIMADTCRGNCPIGTCLSCPCRIVTSPQSISYWCSKYIRNQIFCEFIVSHRSGGNINAMKSWITELMILGFGKLIVNIGVNVMGHCTLLSKQ